MGRRGGERGPRQARFHHVVWPSPADCAAARAGIGWSTDRLAEAAGVSRMTVLNYEHGRRTPRPGTLIAIRRALRGAGAAIPDVQPERFP